MMTTAFFGRGEGAQGGNADSVKAGEYTREFGSYGRSFVDATQAALRTNDTLAARNIFSPHIKQACETLIQALKRSATVLDTPQNQGVAAVIRTQVADGTNQPIETDKKTQQLNPGQELASSLTEDAAPAPTIR